MNVVDIHPEELIDKLQRGSLSVGERERLDAHLAQCSACRFELSVRADLASEIPAIDTRPQLTFGDGAPTKPPPLAELGVRRASPSLRVRSRRRFPMALLAAALVLSAGGAMAAVFTGAVSGPWLRWSPAVKPAESSAPVPKVKPVAKPKRAAAKISSSEFESPADSAPATPAQTAEPVPASPAVAVVLPATPSAPRARRSEVAQSEPLRLRAAPPATSVNELTSGTTDVGGNAPRDDAPSLFADANRARRDGNGERAVSLYRTLQSRYPSSPECRLSRALLAQLLLERGNAEAALAGFDRYLSDDSPVLSAEALVGRAKALEQLGQSAQAAVTWRQVQSRFPGSVHARLAASRLAALGTR